MDMWTTQARCPHAHSDNNKSSRQFKNWAKIYPLDHAMKLTSITPGIGAVNRETAYLDAVCFEGTVADRSMGSEFERIFRIASQVFPMAI